MYTNLLYIRKSIADMNFYSKKRIVFILITFLFSFNLLAQVTIGSIEKPVVGSLLQLKNIDGNGAVTATKGMMLPRVELTDLAQLYPMLEDDADYVNGVSTALENTEHVGLVVYNMGCHMTGEGFYVWTGVKWVPIAPRKIESTDRYKGANSYIVKPGNSLSIPVERAFKVWQDYQKAGATATASEIDAGKVLDLAAVNNLSGNFTVDVVWEQTSTGGTSGVLASAPVLVGTDETATINVQTGTEFGNALLALKVDNKIVWTWHIWVPESDPTDLEAQIYCYGGLVWMDRNLGATDTIPNSSKAYGLYYQFGRMLPFKNGTNGQTVVNQNKTGNETTMLTFAIQSGEFITRTTSDSQPNDWYSNTISKWTSRWSGNGESKSPFDPCPEGWRVPYNENNRTPWPEFSNVVAPPNWDAGFHYTRENVRLGYWPAAGYINYSNAQYSQQSEVGSNWSATYVGNNSRYHRLLFSQPILLNNEASVLATALSVRCVAEYD